MMVQFFIVGEGEVWINPEKVAYVAKYPIDDKKTRIVLSNGKDIVVKGTAQNVANQLDEGGL